MGDVSPFVDRYSQATINVDGSQQAMQLKKAIVVAQLQAVASTLGSPYACRQIAIQTVSKEPGRAVTDFMATHTRDDTFYGMFHHKRQIYRTA